MYSAVTEKLCGFAHLQEGKTMGLAGHATHGAGWEKLFGATITDPTNPCDLWSGQFLDERAGYRQMQMPTPGMRARTAADDPVSAPFVHYAYAAQEEMESAVMHLVRGATSLLPSKRLCYSGGVALNIPANRLMLDSGLFEDLFIQPAASDTGIPLGAALLGYYAILGGTRRWEMTTPFLARPYAGHEIDEASTLWRGEQATAGVSDIAKLLANDYLLAWFQGASEYGPRALGHRSILCSPRHPQMKAYLNQEVSIGEMFRPFAPIVTIEFSTSISICPFPRRSCC